MVKYILYPEVLSNIITSYVRSTCGQGIVYFQGSRGFEYIVRVVFMVRMGYTCADKDNRRLRKVAICYSGSQHTIYGLYMWGWARCWMYTQMIDMHSSLYELIY